LLKDQTYEIINGVRRAEAMQMAGRQTIRARSYAAGGGRFIREFDVPLHQLRSPHKSAIRLVSRADHVRWQRIVSAAKLDPVPFPAIEIQDGARGAKVEDVSFDFGPKPWFNKTSINEPFALLTRF
jgi:hypothetical protein